jgi:hypothetical protein
LSVEVLPVSLRLDQPLACLGATVVHAMWADALTNAQVISTDATGALIQPTKGAKDGRAESCKKGHFFTAVVDCDAVLFAYVEHHSRATKRAGSSVKAKLKCPLPARKRTFLLKP